MLRYLRALSDKDVALDRSMIPLGSCTMKLNATAEMEPITWPEFADLHPFAPVEDAKGLLQLIADLERWLAEITGYDAVSLQPNAGSARANSPACWPSARYHRARGEADRDVCLIPSSAHGTNAASAVMAGMRVVVVGCDERRQHRHGRPRRKIAISTATDLAAIMITYPSTHGVYEDTVARGLRDGARRRRPGVRRRGQPERADRPGPAGQVRRRRVAPEPAQDVLHPARRRRPRRRPDRRARAPGPVPAQPPAPADRGPGDRVRSDLGRAVGQRVDPADLRGRTCG